jgi:hypothetical protein
MRKSAERDYQIQGKQIARKGKSRQMGISVFTCPCGVKISRKFTLVQGRVIVPACRLARIPVLGCIQRARCSRVTSHHIEMGGRGTRDEHADKVS